MEKHVHCAALTLLHNNPRINFDIILIVSEHQLANEFTFKCLVIEGASESDFPLSFILFKSEVVLAWESSISFIRNFCLQLTVMTFNGEENLTNLAILSVELD